MPERTTAPSVDEQHFTSANLPIGTYYIVIITIRKFFFLE